MGNNRVNCEKIGYLSRKQRQKQQHKAQNKAMSNRGGYQKQKRVQPHFQEVRQVMEYQDAEGTPHWSSGSSSTLQGEMKLQFAKVLPS